MSLDPMATARRVIAVIESRRRFEALLMRVLGPEGFRVLGHRRPAELLARVGAEHVGLVLIDFGIGPADGLRLIDRLRDHVPTLVLLRRPELDDLEWPARELGALAVLDDLSPLHDIADLCRRQFPGEYNQHAARLADLLAGVVPPLPRRVVN